MSVFRFRVAACVAVVFGCCLALAALSVAQEPVGQNTTKKRRMMPNALAAKVGTAVDWQPDLEKALARSRDSGKPVFWYVATVPGTFMDRKTEIDRYMLAGPFSWPPIVKLLNEHFIPTRALPGKKDQRLGIRPYDFIEPGFVVLSREGEVIAKVDAVTTFQYDAIQNLLASVLRKAGRNAPTVRWPGYFRQFSGPDQQWIDPYGQDFDRTPANLLLSGMIAFRKGDHDLARRRWQEAAKSDPGDPLAWKAALEAQGLGPFVRGFEVFREIPEKAQSAGLLSRGSSAPINCYSKKQLIGRSVDFLLGMQRQDGAFVDSDYDFGGYDSLPNVHVAVTSLVGMALLKYRNKVEKRQQEKVEQALRRIYGYVTDEKNLNHADRDEILWACAYRLRFLSRLKKTDSGLIGAGGFQDKLVRAVQTLESIQLKTGNWYHEYSNPFVTATALCALDEARVAGAKTDQTRIQRGLQALLRDRESNGAYPYYSVRQPANRSADARERMLLAAAGRMPRCELALLRWGKADQRRLGFAVENSLRQHRHLATGYKYDNHTSNMAYGGFFFWYDMWGRSEAIRAVRDHDLRNRLNRQQQALILGLPELDGCFVDSHELGRCYGTAMALLSMDPESDDGQH